MPAAQFELSPRPWRRSQAPIPQPGFRKSYFEKKHLAHSVPPPPEFGEPLPVKKSQAVLDFLALRRSASAATLQAPGPSADELSTLLRLAARAPDHGKLSPWRFVVLEGAEKQAFVEGLERLAA